MREAPPTGDGAFGVEDRIYIGGRVFSSRRRNGGYRWGKEGKCNVIPRSSALTHPANVVPTANAQGCAEERAIFVKNFSNHVNIQIFF